MEKYEVGIIGGGPIGLACAIQATKSNISHVIWEKGVLVNSIFNFPTNMTFFSTSNLLEIGEVPFIAHGDKPTRREALEYYRRVWQSWKLNAKLYEEVIKVEEADNDWYRVETGKSKYLCRHIIVATGFFGQEIKMNVPGEELSKVRHYYDEAHPYIGQKVLVIGAANSACDVALETYLKGADVTMAVRSDRIYDRVKYWIKPNIDNRIKEGSIKAYFNTEVIKIEEKKVLLKTPTGKVEIENDFVLAMTGYQPDYNLFEKVGITWQDDEFHTPNFDEASLETNRANIYLAGVICGGLKTNRLFIENSRIHATMIFNHILKK